MSDTKMGETKKSNPMLKWIIVHIIVIAALAAGLLVLTKLPKGGDAPKDTVVYLVRHAEKVTGENAGRDPALTAAGEARAKALAEILKDKNITHIYSSDYVRTRNTAAPTADLLRVGVEIYNPRDLDALATKIKETKGHILVVGHSNTIPETVDALGGVGGAPINEKSEYDRLYVVTISEDGMVQTQLKRYGVKYVTQE